MILKTNKYLFMSSKQVDQEALVKSCAFLQRMLSNGAPVSLWAFIYDLEQEDSEMSAACKYAVHRILEVGYSSYTRELLMDDPDFTPAPNPFSPESEEE